MKHTESTKSHDSFFCHCFSISSNVGLIQHFTDFHSRADYFVGECGLKMYTCLCTHTCTHTHTYTETFPIRMFCFLGLPIKSRISGYKWAHIPLLPSHYEYTRIPHSVLSSRKPAKQKSLSNRSSWPLMRKTTPCTDNAMSQNTSIHPPTFAPLDCNLFKLD